MKKYSEKEYSFEPVRSVNMGDVIYVKDGNDFIEVVISRITDAQKWCDTRQPRVPIYCSLNKCYWLEEIFKIKDSHTRSCDVSSPPPRTSQQKFEDIERLKYKIDSDRTPRFNYKDRG